MEKESEIQLLEALDQLEVSFSESVSSSFFHLYIIHAQYNLSFDWLKSQVFHQSELTL